MDGVFPGAVWRPMPFTTRAFPQAPLGWILHVAQMTGSPHDLFAGSVAAGDPKVSTGWVAKDGRCEQYVPVSHIPWSQVAGNGTYLGWETEGDAAEPLTDAQLTTLARIHVWQGTVDAVADAPGVRGIGTHQMGGSAWGGHACPGPIRAGQRAEILRRARTLRAGGTDVPLTDAEVDRIATATRDKILAVTYGTGGDGKPFTLAMLLGEVRVNVLNLVAKLKP